MDAINREAVLLTSAAVVGVACAKLGSAIGDDAAVMVGGRNLRGDLVDMKTTLEAIGAPLEMRSTGEEWVQVGRWLKRVKEAAYDICEMLDDLQADNTTPPAANTIRTGVLTGLAIVPNATNEIANRTNEMRDNLRVIQEESPSFSSAIRSSYASEGLLLYRRRETTPPHIIVEETIITGRDADKQRIMLDVLSATDEGPIILPILGLRGIGRTTLAKLVSYDARFKDYTKVWVSVSETFGLIEIGRCIISQLSGAESNKDSNDMEFIMGRLNELLGGKKLLVVLDDLWFMSDDSELDRFRHMFSPSDKGSKRICTLRPYRLDPLSDDMCWTIIKQKSALEDRADKQELEQIGREIANKCMGFPLAAQALGYMLRSKDLRAWSMLLNNINAIRKRDEYHPVYSTLVLCCQQMPPNLRLCFAYCAIFPRGHSIARDELIHQWIALDFIQPSDRFSTTQLAEGYITTLLAMSFLEPTKSASTSGKDDKGAMLLTMHGMVHEFAWLLFGYELFVVDPIYEISHEDNNRRYALITDFGRYFRRMPTLIYRKPLNLSSVLNARLRAVHFLGCSEMELLSDGAFSSAKRLRVLDLRDCPMQKLPDSICQLRHLRYLNLSGHSGLVNLPEPFGGIKNLVYLYLSGCSGLVELPESFGKLKNLMHLDLSGCSGLVKLPESFEKLENLMHLDLSVCFGLVKLPYSFGKLKNLVYLDLSGCSGLVKLPDSFGKLEHLVYLALSGCSGLVKLPDKLPESFEKLENLAYLDLSSCSGLVKLPDSFGKLEHLMHLDLSVCFGLVKLPDSFGKLKNLVYLDLSGCSGLVKLPDSFGKLEHLMHLDLSVCFGLVKLPDSFGKLKSLVHLDLSGCSCFEGIPTALRGLTNLQHLNLSHPCCYFVEHRFHLKELTDVWGDLTKLQYLNLSMCLNPILCYLPEEESLEYIQCISGLSSLEHLDLSHNIFLCDLPESLGELTKLHTLDLSGCIRLKRLNKWVGEMNSLKFLVKRNCRGLENYQFVVRADDGGYSSNLVQLEGVNSKGLEISCLEKVMSIEEAHRVRLVDNRKLKRLTLAWTVGCRGSVVDNALLGELVPPHNLRCLELHGYNGICLPAWTLSLSSYLPNLVEVTMEDIPRCSRLPPLALLPNLQQVVLRRMASITRIDASDLIGGNRAAAFLRLLKFTLDDMERLEEWNTTYYSGGEEFMFPAIDELVINSCPKLSFRPDPPRAQKMSLISTCDQVMSSLGTRGVGGHCVESSSACSTSATVTKHSLQSLCFSHCDSMTSLPESLGGLNSLQELQIVCCKHLQSLPDSMQHLTSLQSVHFNDCESITALPKWFGGLTSLHKLAIHKCHAIKSLPQNIRKLTNLKNLHIVDCPELENWLKNWCESEENKNWLSRIRPKYEEHGTDKPDNAVTVYGKQLTQIRRCALIL